VVDDPPADGVDEPGALQQGDELGGGDGAELGVLPAQQGFDRRAVPGVQVELGLVERGEGAVVAHTVSEGGVKASSPGVLAGEGGGVGAVGEAPDLGFAGAFRGEHGAVGVP